MALRADMQDLTDRIRHARTMEDLIPFIETLSARMETAMRGRTFSDDDLEQLIVPLAAIRLFLGHLDLSEQGAAGGQTRKKLVQELSRNCLDIEGRLKEIRNDHFRQTSGRQA